MVARPASPEPGLWTLRLRGNDHPTRFFTDMEPVSSQPSIRSRENACVAGEALHEEIHHDAHPRDAGEIGVDDEEDVATTRGALA